MNARAQPTQRGPAQADASRSKETPRQVEGIAFEDNRPQMVAQRRLQNILEQNAARLADSPVMKALRNPVSVRITQLKKKYVAENPPNRQEGDITAKKYFTRLKTELGTKAVDREDLEWLETAATSAWSGTSGTPRKELSAEGWRHIWRGDIGSGGHPTGFHWKGKAGEAWSEGDGEQSGETDAGFYHEGVRFKDSAYEASGFDSSKVKRNGKPDGSTFFPDDWTEQEVKDGIELRNSSDQITKPDKGQGTKLKKSGETIYPDIS